MAMIPGAYEPRDRAGPAVERAATAPASLTGSHLAAIPALIAPGAELPSWVRIALFAVALLAVTWLAMFVKSVAR